MDSVPRKIYFAWFVFAVFFPLIIFSQNPVSLRVDVSVQFVMNVKGNAARVAKDPISKTLFYITSDGNVYQIKNLSTTPYDTLLYTYTAHGIKFLQGMAFMDSTLFLIGNTKVDSTTNVGLIKKAVLKPSGSRAWSTVATTGVYAQSYTWYDHGFSGIVVSPDKNYLYISSGSRTDHGEEQNNNGLYPGLREEPLTSAIFKLPSNSLNLILPNNTAALASYLYADGVRNSFDLAFDKNDNLFATENSGDRDDPDELNWIRQGKHYGFPWIMGGNNNPQQYPGYSPANDKLLNGSCNCSVKGYYYNDPSFPPQGSVVCIPSIKNMGPDCDKYREVSGQVNDGSSSGNYISSFTPHRCPLGLSFDKNNILGSDLKGDGFLVSFTRGGDSTGLDTYGYPGTVCDPGQDLVRVKLTPDGFGEYKMQTNIIVNNFDYPVDTYLDSNSLYVIEYAYSGNGRLFKVTLPVDLVDIKDNNISDQNFIYPNPSEGVFTLKAEKEIQAIEISNTLGERIYYSSPVNQHEQQIDLSTYAKGIYFMKLKVGDTLKSKKIILE